MLVGARPQDLNAALNVSYDYSFCTMHVFGFSQSFLLHYTILELHFKNLPEQGSLFSLLVSQVQNVEFALVLLQSVGLT